MNMIDHLFYFICLDRMVVGFTTTYAISAYHHWCREFESQSGGGVQHYVIKFVSDLQQVGGFPIKQINLLNSSFSTRNQKFGFGKILAKIHLRPTYR
jgi:hypothetical protein